VYNRTTDGLVKMNYQYASVNQIQREFRVNVNAGKLKVILNKQII
jgi:hypothetical protein